MKDKLVMPNTLRKLIYWRCPKGCDAGVEWNSIRTEAICKRCGTKSRSRAEDIIENNHSGHDRSASDYDPYA